MINTIRNGEWLEICSPTQWSGFSIDYILRQVWQAPKKQIHQMRMNKDVRINNGEANWNAPLHENDKIEMKLFHPQLDVILPSPIDIQILYEDDHLLIVNKPAQMDTHPNTEGQTHTLANAVANHLHKNQDVGRVLHIHRLDKDTTGAVLFAKHSLAGALLDKKLEQRKIKRTYTAIVHGMLPQMKATIHKPIGKDRHHPTRRRVSANGQDAITHYEVIDYDQKKKLSLIKCQLDTGRTHQIRVHLSHIGHPLAGDIVYGGKPIYTRQALHAIQLTFTHPFTEELITCIAPFIDEPKIFYLDPYTFK